MSEIIIKNGKIIDPETNTIYVGDIYIKDGIVTGIEKTSDGRMNLEADIEAEDGDSGENEVQIIDATNLMVGPGLADTHVHFRDPGFTYKEDIISGAMAAKKGGYTHIVLMANTNPHVDNVDTLKYVLDKGNTTGIHISTCGNVTMDMKGETLTDMELLYQEGAVGFTDDGVPVMDEELCKAAMQKCLKLGVPISFHEENPAFIENNGVNRGKASDYYNIGGSPREAETDLINRDIKLAKDIYDSEGKSPCIVIQHISTAEGVELVNEAKKMGIDIHAEATPHHFSLTEEAVIKHGTNAKMNPPLRTENDRLAIVRGLADGSIDMIATDHAPHAKEEKGKDITSAPSGIIGLETAFSLAIKNLINTGALTYPELFNRMSLSPCKLYKLDGGTIKVGKSANIMIFSPEEEWIVNENEICSKSANTPFIGEKLPGVIKYTICDGNIVYR